MISKRKDGTLYPEECTWSVIRNRTGEIMNYVSIGRDMTEKLRFESMREAARTDRVLPEGAGELANHLKSLLDHLDRLEAVIVHGDRTDDLARFIDDAREEALRIGSLPQDNRSGTRIALSRYCIS